MNLLLKENNYIYVPNFLTVQEADSLAQEFFVAQREGRLSLDPQCPSSPGTYNLMACVKMLVKKVPHVSELCEEDVLPTYTYGRIYQHGEILHRHRDRIPCEVSVTVNLQKDEFDWPIWIQKPDGTEASINLNTGDGMVYLGHVADHWREPYQGKCQTQAFFHYVFADGKNCHSFFDIDAAAGHRGYRKI